MGDMGEPGETWESLVAQVVAAARHRISGPEWGSVRIDVAGPTVVVTGPATRPAGLLLRAGAAVFDLRAGAAELGWAVETEILSAARDPSIWAVLTLHPRRAKPAEDVAWPTAARLVHRSSQPVGARDLAAACVRGAAEEGVSVRVAPMPLPTHIGLILRAKGTAGASWFAVGQAWAGIERLANRCGWATHLRLPPNGGPLPAGGTTWFSAQAEVWVLRRDELEPASGEADQREDRGER